MKPVPPQPLRLQGPAGVLEAVLEEPDRVAAGSVATGRVAPGSVARGSAPTAFAVVCHPHPQHGGTLNNKVVTTVARACNELGMPSLRFNFRGVGASEGSFDDGRGEQDDALAVIAEGRRRWPDAALWLAGFSFGGVVALRVAAAGNAAPAQLITVAPALDRYFTHAADVPRPTCPWLLVQGDADEVLDSAAVLALVAALPTPPRTVVLAGVGHFFHGQLAALRDAVLAAGAR